MMERARIGRITMEQQGVDRSTLLVGLRTDGRRETPTDWAPLRPTRPPPPPFFSSSLSPSLSATFLLRERHSLGSKPYLPREPFARWGVWNCAEENEHSFQTDFTDEIRSLPIFLPPCRTLLSPVTSFSPNRMTQQRVVFLLPICIYH